MIASSAYTASITTYNLTITGVHTYYVLAGTTPILVHNCYGSINSDLVRFSQDSVSPQFSTGQTIEQTAAQLRDGSLDPQSLVVRLFYKDGHLYTLDNRRLVAFQKAGAPIPFRMATPEELAKEVGRKMTTVNEGTSIVIRGTGTEWAP